MSIFTPATTLTARRLSFVTARLTMIRSAVSRVRSDVRLELPRLRRVPYLREWMQAAGYDRFALAELAILPVRTVWWLEHGLPSGFYNVLRISAVFGLDAGVLMGTRPEWHTHPETRPTMTLAGSLYLPLSRNENGRSFATFTPTTRLQVIETAGEWWVFLPRLWCSVQCEADGSGYDDKTGHLVDQVPELKAILAATGLDQEAALRIVFCEEAAPLAIAAQIAQTVDRPLLELAYF